MGGQARQPVCPQARGLNGMMRRFCRETQRDETHRDGRRGEGQDTYSTQCRSGPVQHATGADLDSDGDVEKIKSLRDDTMRRGHGSRRGSRLAGKAGHRGGDLPTYMKIIRLMGRVHGLKAEVRSRIWGGGGRRHCTTSVCVGGHAWLHWCRCRATLIRTEARVAWSRRRFLVLC